VIKKTNIVSKTEKEKLSKEEEKKGDKDRGGHVHIEV
jgi:hypothetical protein